MKYIYALLISCFSFGLNAQNLGADFSSAVSSFTENIEFSEEFINNLKTCTPFLESKKDDLIISTDYKYEIIGKKEDKCEFVFTSDTEMSHFVNRCLFNNEELDEYTNALFNLKNKKLDASELFSNTDYLTAIGVIFDTTLCSQEIKGLDYTLNLRKNLLSCSPYKKEITMRTLKMSMEIFGKKNDKCPYKEVTSQKIEDFSKIFPEEIPSKFEKAIKNDIIIVVSCLFSVENAKKYSEALEKSAIKERNLSELLDSDFNNINTAPKMMKDFIEKNICLVKDNI